MSDEKKNNGKKHHFSPQLIRDVFAGIDEGSRQETERIDKLMRYIVYIENPKDLSYRENPLSRDEIKKIEKLCNTDKEWQSLFQSLQQEFHQIQKSINEGPLGHIHEPIYQVQPKRHRLLKLFSIPQPIPRIAVVFSVILLIGVATFSAHFIITPNYYSSAVVDPVVSTTRGGTSMLTQGINDLYEKNYISAIKYFDSTIEKPVLPEIVLEARYLRGICYLSKAYSSFFGFYPRFNQTDVSAGIQDFHDVIAAISLIDSTSSLIADSHFYLGKAYMMEEKISLARNEFLKSMEQDKRHSLEINRILVNLNEK